MKCLLDTHTFLWFAIGDERLSGAMREIIEDPDCDAFVSVVSCWEIAIKSSLGRLNLKMPLGQMFSDEIEGNGLKYLDIERRHLLELPSLPPAHGDPFDRLLVAQARVAKLIFISNDRLLDAYGIKRIW